MILYDVACSYLKKVSCYGLFMLPSSLLALIHLYSNPYTIFDGVRGSRDSAYIKSGV